MTYARLQATEWVRVYYTEGHQRGCVISSPSALIQWPKEKNYFFLSYYYFAHWNQHYHRSNGQEYYTSPASCPELWGAPHLSFSIPLPQSPDRFTLPSLQGFEVVLKAKPFLQNVDPSKFLFKNYNVNLYKVDFWDLITKWPLAPTFLTIISVFIHDCFIVQSVPL